MTIYCEACNDTGEVEITSNGIRTFESCQECCPHYEHDHGICLDCGKDNYEDLAAQAYDRAKDYWKYGE